MTIVAPDLQEKTGIEWLIGKATLPNTMRKRLLAKTERISDNAIIGKMYFFSYWAKYSDTLPVWDRYPLVFPIEPYSDGFLGLNLHFLQKNERQWLLNKLSEYRNNSFYDKNTKLKIYYGMLGETKKLATVSKPCIKRYLFTQVRSPFIEILPVEWAKVIDLPVYQFKYNH